MKTELDLSVGLNSAQNDLNCFLTAMRHFDKEEKEKEKNCKLQCHGLCVYSCDRKFLNQKKRIKFLWNYIQNKLCSSPDVI